jgi:G:T/U mismatch-specific DNA glycosylase
MNDATRQLHTIPPFFDSNSKTLILGSFPSVKSRQSNFYYGHPKNRFWQVLATVFECKVPTTIDEKKAFLLAHGIALWDVVGECDIAGSSDASIKHALPNDLCVVLNNAPVTRIFLNGKIAEKYYLAFGKNQTTIPATVLPSTSPANATYTFPKLVLEWKTIK